MQYNEHVWAWYTHKRYAENLLRFCISRGWVGPGVSFTNGDGK